jgi:hypothetical protein
MYFGGEIKHTILDAVTALCDPRVPKSKWWEATSAAGMYEEGEIPYERFV